MKERQTLANLGYESLKIWLQININTLKYLPDF